MSARASEDRHAPDRDRGRLINWGELLATCLASALATMLLSRLGVAGTVLGAAVTPLIITLTTTALSNGRPREAAGRRSGEGGRPSLDPERRRRLRAALATAAAATGILVAAITFANAVSGEPAHERPTPTDGRRPAAQPSPTPTAPARTPTPTPTPTPTATPRTTPTPTPTAPAASPTAAP